MKNVPSGFFVKTLKFSFLFISLFVFFISVVHATIYYVSSSSGNDGNTGVSTSYPWKTLAKVNITIFPGDSVLFNRGDAFYGSLSINQSGAFGSPITFGAYGSGNKPIITEFTTIIGWTNEGEGIYSKIINSESPTNMVIIDGRPICNGKMAKRWFGTLLQVFMEGHKYRTLN